MFRIEMLPALHGDALWIEYGQPDRPRRVLIDGGPKAAASAVRERIAALPAGDRHLELLVVTHIDADHIEGAIELLEDEGLQLTIGDVWFNGWRHLPGSGFEEFGPVQGEKLTMLLDRPNGPWNAHFGRSTVMVSESGELPSHSLDGGLTLTVLSPGKPQLALLKPVWDRVCREAGIDPHKPKLEPPEPPAGFESMGPLDIDALAAKPFQQDTSEANGSSIALLAEFEGRRALFTGDAYSPVLGDSIARLASLRGENRLALDAFKLPHHGSKSNVDASLLEKITCGRFLFSTSGARFRHPDKEAVARVIKYGGPDVALVFNYRSEFTEIWDDPSLKARYRYRTQYPETGQQGIAIAF